MHNTPWTPNIFTDSGPPIKRPLEGLIKGAPDPPDPPYGGGGQNIFGGVITDGPFRPKLNQIFWEALDSNIISVMLQEAPDP